MGAAKRRDGAVVGVNIGRLWPDDLSDRARRASEELASCRLCARACDVDRRTDAEAGYCRLDSRAWVYKELLSFGEEALISPTG